MQNKYPATLISRLAALALSGALTLVFFIIFLPQTQTLSAQKAMPTPTPLATQAIVVMDEAASAEQNPITVTRGFSELLAVFYDSHNLTGAPVYTTTYSAPIDFSLTGSYPSYDHYPFSKLVDQLANGGIYSVRWEGKLLVPATGVYTFTVPRIDEGVQIALEGTTMYPEPFLDDHFICNNPYFDNVSYPEYLYIACTSISSPHPSPQAVTLTAGVHAITINYTQRMFPGASLQIKWAGPGFTEEVIPVARMDRDRRWGPGCPLCGDTDISVGGPINTFNGNYNYMQQDVSIPALGQPLLFKRSYNAQSSDLYTNTSTVGYGWTDNYNLRLITSTQQPGGEAGVVIFQGWAGGRFRFLKIAGEDAWTYTPMPGIHATLTRTLTVPYTYTLTTVDQTIYTFNAAGRPVAIRDPRGNITNLTYSGTLLSRVADATGQRYLNLGYNGQGRVYTITDPINRSITYTYDITGNLTLVTDTRGFTWTYTYTGTNQHLLYEVRGPQNTLVERTDYDGQNRAVRQWTNAASQPLQIQYVNSVDASGFPTQTVVITDTLGRVSLDDYNARGTLIGQYRAEATTGRNYDAAFNWTSRTDANNHSTGYVFDAVTGQPRIITDAATLTTSMQYDALNNLTQLVDSRGTPTDYTYSGTLLTRQTDALGNTTVYTYGPNNLLIAQEDALGRVTRYDYNPFGQRIMMTDALTNTTRYEYDPIGRLMTTTDAIGRMTVNAYDNADHLIAVTNNFTTTSAQQNLSNTWNLITRYAYDGFGRQTAVTDTLNHITRNYFDGAGRLISVTANFTTTGGVDPTVYNLKTWYGYDAVGNQVTVTDTLQHVTLTEYDTLNRPVTVTQNSTGNGLFDPSKPDENVKRITPYDPAGNVIEQIDPPNANGESRVTRNWYDALNRVISTTANYTTTPGADPNTYNLTTWYEYDPAGNQVAITDTQQHVTRNYYDPLGRLISITVNYCTDMGPNYLNQYNLTTWYEYDAVGNRVAITDPLNTPTRYTYDKLNHVIATINVSGTATTQYDAIGNRVAVTDALTHTTVYTYNAVGQLIAEGNPVIGNITRYQYDALGRTLIVTDALTHPTRTFYDAAGRVVSTTNALTGTTVITYNALGQQVGFLNENSKASYMAYDGLGRTVAVTDATNSVMQYQYDAVGNRVKVIDGLTHVMTSTYDIANRLIKTQDAVGNTTRYGYDGLGNRVVMTDANGIVTGYGYDALNRLNTVTESMTSTLGLDPNQYNLLTRYGYDPIGNRSVMTNARGYTTTYRYDVLSRLIAMTDPLTHTTWYQYDAVGNRTRIIDANNQTTVYTYDVINRNMQIDYGASRVTFEYDLIGNRKAMTDSLGVTRYLYDALNRPISVTDSLTGTVQYRYDAASNRTQTVYPDGKVVTSTFDAANHLTGTLSWDGQVTTYAFDQAGRLITTTLPNGIQTINGYDNANRLIRLTHKRSGPTLGDYQYTLDGVGNRKQTIEMLPIFGSTTLTGTSVFTVAASTDDAYIRTDNQSIDLTSGSTVMGNSTMGSTIINHYYAGYRFNAMALPAGFQLLNAQLRLMAAQSETQTVGLFVYGEAMAAPATYSTYNDFTLRPLTANYVGLNASTWTANQDYATDVTPVMAELLEIWSNGNPMAFRVNDVINVDLLTGPGGSTPLVPAVYHIRHAYSKDGSSGSALPARLMLTYTYPVGTYVPVTTTINYTYDPLYRLTNANYSDAYTYTFSYGYDKVGNRTVQTRTITSTQVTTYTYDIANRMTKAGGVNNTWDDNGNLINDGSATYLYDRANRMISTTVGGVTSLYAYNGDGARLKQTVAGTVTTYTQDLAAPLPVVLQSKTGANATRYVYALGTRPLAQYGTVWEYLLPDALGSVRQVVDANGNVTLAESYEPYGSVLNSNGSASSVYGFTSEQLDSQTGLLFLRARYMQPKLGVFLSHDPWLGDQFKPRSMNGWNYASDDPINRVDPTGQVDWPTCAIEGIPGICVLCTLNDLYKYADLTQWLVDEMNANRTGTIVQSIQQSRNSILPGQGTVALLKFKDVVQDHALWDFKYKIEEIIGMNIRLGDTWYNADVPGNIHFGYLGYEIGFSGWLLHCGADYATNKALCSGADSPEDYEAIETGFDISRYSYGSDVTVEALKTALKAHPGMRLGFPQIPRLESFEYRGAFSVGTFDGKRSQQHR